MEKQFNVISTLLLMLALLVAGRQELTIYEDVHSGDVISHHVGVHNHHEHVVNHHLHMEESTPHHHHRHMMLDLDIVPCFRDALVRFLLVIVVVGVGMALLLSLLHIRQLRSIDFPPWPNDPERVSRIGGIGFCRPMLN